MSPAVPEPAVVAAQDIPPAVLARSWRSFCRARGLPRPAGGQGPRAVPDGWLAGLFASALAEGWAADHRDNPARVTDMHVTESGPRRVDPAEGLQVEVVRVSPARYLATGRQGGALVAEVAWDVTELFAVVDEVTGS